MRPRSIIRLERAIVAAVFCCLLGAGWRENSSFAQTPVNGRVLVVYSHDSESRAVARYYMAQRKIPETNGCKIAVNSNSTVNQAEFERQVKLPVRTCLESIGKRKILYIVFSYRTPYLLVLRGRTFALDQFVADIWDEYASLRPGNEAGPHPYFGGAQSQGNAYESFLPLAEYREQPRALNIYSVWRLDAANARLAKGLVDKAMLAEAAGLRGKGCFDLQFGGVDRLPDTASASGDWDVHQAAEFARQAGFQVIEDDKTVEFGTPPAPLRCDDAAFYAGWYSLNHYNDAFTWSPGAIGFHLDSASAADPRGGTNWSANAILKGITVTSGAVAEPFLIGLPHPDQVLRYLLQGACVGDALLRSTIWLKWMILNIGDPLYRPFPHGVTPFNLPGHPENFLALAPQFLAGGNPSFGVVGLSRPAAGAAITVALKSERPDVASVPKTVTIASGTAVARFPITTHAVTAETAVRISVNSGEFSRSNTLVLYPAQR